jgi:hypothetical protein
MEIDKTEVKAILKMLQSEDKENAIVGFEILKQINQKKYLGELIILYKYGKCDSAIWSDLYPKGFKILYKTMPMVSKPSFLSILSSQECITKMVELNTSKQSKELFMELFSKQTEQNFIDLGYPPIEVSINLKKYE